MTFKLLSLLLASICCNFIALAQPKIVKTLAAQRFEGNIKIDGVLNEPVWKTAPVADSFVEARPVPF